MLTALWDKLKGMILNELLFFPLLEKIYLVEVASLLLHRRENFDCFTFSIITVN